MGEFKVVSEYEPRGDQPNAIKELSYGIKHGEKAQALLGITGSGKTFTIANVIQEVQKPTLVIAHNKTLAAQLCSEFKEFFPNNSVEYFVSYYDYYQPEAYIPSTDTYIEKDSTINDDIDKLRHSATAALSERNDVIIVASVSCIYGLGDPIDYNSMVLSLRPQMHKDRDEVIKRLVHMQYERNDIAFVRGKFRVRGDILEIFPADESEKALRIEFFGDVVEKISEIEVLTGKTIGIRSHCIVFPASHYVTTPEKMQRAMQSIEEELEERVKELKAQDKILEAQRILQRTNFDLEMMQEIGFCQGIENYSRHISGREQGSAPFTLLDYFPKDFLLVIDESHVTIPQVGGMFHGDRSRKDSLVEYGFRLPSAYDNRPLCFDEFKKKINQVIFVSATPGNYERSHSKIVEQIIRPTGLIDPVIEVHSITGQIDHLIGQIRERVEMGHRVLVTTLTKKMSEDLTDYMKEINIRVRYLHSDIDTIERMQILRDLRLGEFDVLVGINLLIEGLDLPEVSLVAILDADKPGFLRSETSLIQTIGRAARNVEGTVIMYGDQLTDAMEKAIEETNRRRKLQIQYNKENNITPKSIQKGVREVIQATKVAEEEAEYKGSLMRGASIGDINKIIRELTVDMKDAASNLQFERAAELRDRIKELKKEIHNL